MKKLLYVISSLGGLLLAACQKNNSSPANSTTNSTSSANTSISNGLPSASVNGVLIAQKLDFPSLSFTLYKSNAGFNSSAQSLQVLNPFTTIVSATDYADTLKLNSTILKYETVNPNSLNTYSDTVSASNYSGGVSWNLKGNATFPSFNTAVSRGFPTIANTSLLPASFSKSNPLTITFGAGNITNADSIGLMLTGGSSGFGIYKSVGPGATSITFSPAEMTNATAGSSNNQIFLYTKNYSNMTVNGKTYAYVMHYTLGAFVSITP
ncbi:MAG: hypothetical protein ACJ76F_11710 [Bacteroidia bacterium]